MNTPYYEDESVTVHHGDCLDVLVELPDASVDAVVTDPPYGLEFMGKDWDGSNGFRRSLNAADVGRNNVFGRSSRTSPEYRADGTFQRWCSAWAAECLRILKPGGHIVSFGGSRTWHRLAAGIEDAGFEIRDSIAWLYGSGFPKSHNIGEGRGTALKPAFEPIVVGRKPLTGTVAQNVLEHGTGAINIDACRVGLEERTNPAGGTSSLQRVSRVEQGYRENLTTSVGEPSTVVGRWPTNVVLDEDQAAALDQQTGTLTSGLFKGNRGTDKTRGIYGAFKGDPTREVETYGDSGGASRFFPVFRYEAKAPRSERPVVDGTEHPTVKPLELMRWLVRLVTPTHGVVLDPFAGSGTTAEACVLEHMRCITIERESDYLPLIVERLSKPLEIGLDFGEAG